MTLRELEQNTCKLHPFLDKNDVKLLLMHIYGIDNYSQYSLNLDQVVPNESRFTTFLNRLIKGEPIQYILGVAYFYYRDFFVDKNVLIPRVETEELVDFIIKDVGRNNGNLADIGTGSGVIAITLKDHSNLNVFASDISKRALKIALQNDIKKEIKFLHGDLLLPYIKKGITLDFIVANLPYIKAEEVLENKVKDYEPNRALFLPKSNIFARLFRQVKRLKIGENGLQIYLEIGTNQMEELSKLAYEILGDKIIIEALTDMQGKERFLVIKGIYAH